MSRHQASRRRSYGRRQHELRERLDARPRLDESREAGGADEERTFRELDLGVERWSAMRWADRTRSVAWGPGRNVRK